MPARDIASARGYVKYPTPYDTKALGLAPIGYWDLNELTGTVAIDSSINANNGSYVNSAGFELGHPGIGDRSRSVQFNILGTENGYVNIYSAGLNSVFNGAEGSHGIWTRVLNAGVWTDGTFRYAIHNYVDGDNRMYLGKMTTSNQWRKYYESGNVGKNQTAAVTASLDWVHWLQTWSEAADQAITYRNGVQWGSISTALGVWSGGALHGSFNKISTTQGTVGEWSGWLAKGIIFDRALSVADALAVGTL